MEDLLPPAPELPMKKTKPAAAPVVKPESAPVTKEMITRPLYEITNDYLALCDTIAAADGEMTEETIAAWNAIKGERDQKLENCGRVILDLRASLDRVAAEHKRFGKRKTSIKNQADRLRAYVVHEMTECHISKVKGEDLDLVLSNTKPKVTILDENAVPDAFCTTTIKMPSDAWELVRKVVEAALAASGATFSETKEPDKTAILDQWNAAQGTEDVPGTVVQPGKSLRIY